MSIDEMQIHLLECSNSCLKEDKDCSEHTIKVKQFERVMYLHKGKEKMKIN